MRLGLHLSDLTYPGGPASLGADLAAIARTADEAGFDRISVMDHVWQIPNIGPAHHDMLECYTTLGFLAAHTRRARLLVLVTAVTYRDPGLLIKAASTLDVLSGGRSILGIGAAWNEPEARGLGLFFPPRAERFERLEETLQIALQLWSDDEGAYDGKHYQLARTLNRPQPLARPRPPILIGGGGERKTLRLVAKYADACNLFYGPELGHKLDVLREHCEREGRDYDEIEKTVLYPLDPGEDGDQVGHLLDDLARMRELGIHVAHGRVPQVHDLIRLRILGEQVIPRIADW